MRIAVLVARLLLGAIFAFSGLNTLLWSLSDSAILEPQETTEKAQAFLDALTATGFMHPLRGVAEFAGGLMVLTGLFVPLGLLLLAPVLVHILGYHLYLDPGLEGRVVAFLLAALAVFLMLAYARAYRGILNPFARPFGRRRADYAE